MVITRRQALRSSAVAIGGAVVDPQFVKAETTASKPPGQNAGIYRLRLGAFEITVLSDGSFTLPSPLLATNLAEAELKEFVKANHIGADTFRTQINVVLVNTGDQKVLIDAGEGGLRQPTTGRLMASLQAAGIEPTAIDIVVLTHAHPDHLWGAVDTKAGARRFPNARYVISETEWDFWSDPERYGSFPERFRGMIPGTQAAFKLIADRTTRIKAGTEIVSGIATVDSRGHTGGYVRSTRFAWRASLGRRRCHHASARQLRPSRVAARLRRRHGPGRSNKAAAA
jgi:glyoxylase-like metal-dependent hydrolase (beta-lactamase superfamily II)